MARRLLYLIVACVFCVPTPAQAQRGQQIFDFVLQEAQRELERKQQRDGERAQRQDRQRLQRQFIADWQACHGGDLGACDRALTFPNLNPNDRQVLSQRRAQIMAAAQAAADRARQDVEAAAMRDRFRGIERERKEAERHRQRAEQAELERASLTAQLVALQQEQDRSRPWALLWTSAPILGLGLAALLILIGLKRGALVLPAQRLRESALRMVASLRRSAPATAAPGSAAPDPGSVPEPDKAPAQPPPIPAPRAPRDTAGAIAALELAVAYIDEVRAATTPAPDDAEARRHQLNTLSLAAKQLDLAQQLDPDAVLEQPEGVDVVRLTLNEIKAEALLLEGITHQSYDLRRAIPALVAATKLNPSGPRAFYVLGLVHAGNRNKKAAVAAFAQAVALDPKNLAYRKELNRVQNLSGAEIAAYKATRVAERTVDATALAWNIFAVVWNIVMFPLRVVVGAFRFLRLTGFH